MIYWLAIGDHVFFVRLHSMSADLFEQYLSWLLSTRTGVISTSDGVRLQAEFDKSQIAGDIGDIKSIRIGGRAAPQLAVRISPAQPTVAQTTSRTTTRKIRDKFVEFEQAVPVIKALIGDAKTESLVNSLGSEEHLAVNASIKIQGRRTAESRQRFQSIATDLADTTDAKVLIEGKDGAISEGDSILRTRMPFELTNENSSLLDFDNIADQLQEVYKRFVQDRKILA